MSRFTTEAQRTQRRDPQGNRTMRYNELSGKIIQAAIEVHKELGPGLLESVYQTCLLHELRSMGINAVPEVPVPIVYKGNHIGHDLRIDLLVDDRIVVEVKSVEELHPIHTAQVLTYLKLTRNRLGLLINFNATKLVNGVERIMNGFLEEGE